MVMSAILIPVLLVLTAFIYDAGTWFTHKRQLQNRADAGALAAGYQLGIDWPACDGSAATKLLAETRVDNAARQYAGDPEKAATLSLHNTELTEQNRINVEINSNADGGLPGRVDPDTSWNDPAGSGLGPCDAQTRTDRFSPLPNARYVDVGVRERDQNTLFGMFGVNLFRNEAHARVEMKTVAAGKGFLPLAIPDQIIAQAEIRYYRYCEGESPVQIGQPITLQPLGDGTGSSNNYQVISGSSLWGPTVGNEKNGDPTGVPLTLPEEKTCGGNYIPIRAEVRVAGVEKKVIDIDNAAYNGPSGCTALALQKYADCWSQLSEIRLDKENPKTEPWFHEVALSTSSGGCNPDPYFARVTGATTSCSFSASVKVNWNGYGSSPPAGRICTIGVGGTTTQSPDCVSGVFSFSGSDSTLGRSDLTVTWNCTDQDPKFPGNPSKRIQCPGVAGATSVNIRSQFLGNRANSSLVTLVRTSQNPQAPGGGPGAPIDWYPAPQGSTQDITVYPTVGLESALYVGQHRVLRAPHCKGGTNSNNCDLDTSSPGDSQSIDCEPGGGTGGQGHDFGLFANGCRPWYDGNDFDSTNNWWPCPGSLSYNIANPLASTPPNDTNFPWQCVVKAPGFSPNVISDGIATAIGNCMPGHIQSNSCNKYQCINPNYYDQANPDEWSLQGGKPSRRVIFIFVVPYGAYKFTGPQETIPLLTFAAFYVTGWSGSGGSGKNPCEDPKNLPPNPDPTGPAPSVDEDTQGGDIAGYFVGYTMPDAPGDPHSVCVHDQLKPCTPVLVR